MITLYLPWICDSMQQIKKTTQPFPEILTLYFLGEHLTCPGMHDKLKQITHDLTKVSIYI